MLPVHMRWMIQRDHPSVIGIENVSFEFPWSLKELQAALRPSCRIGYVAERSEIIVGYVVYEIHNRYVKLLNMAVHPNFRRQKVGEQLVNHMVQKYLGRTNAARCHIELNIRETNVEGQLFFKKQGFRAVAVLPRMYEETNEDAYLMKLSKFSSIRNRIKDYLPEQFMSELGFSA